MFLMVFGVHYVVVVCWSSHRCSCFVFIMFLLLSSVVLFMLNTHHVVVARHPSCSCCFLVFIGLLLINAHHVATIALHSLCCFVASFSCCVVVFSTHYDIMFSTISVITRLIFRIINFQIEIGKKKYFTRILTYLKRWIVKGLFFFSCIFLKCDHILYIYIEWTLLINFWSMKIWKNDQLNPSMWKWS